MGKTRPPVVVVLGHVDHGKTTLVDAIRKTNLASKEAGGITQATQAFVVSKGGRSLTLIDTPGHAAFSAMRARGAKLADIAILVVAAEDGVKPQTKEALEAILKSEIPFIVAFTKVDLPSASVEAAMGQLEKEGVLFEGRGGQTPFLEISAKKGKGISELMELIFLLWELEEVKADRQAKLDAVTLETTKDKKGLLVALVVREGTLKVGSFIKAGEVTARVRGIFDDQGKSVKEVLPGFPAYVLGFPEEPAVGARVTEALGAGKKEEKKTARLTKGVKKDGLRIYLKARSAGSLEAIIASLPEGVSVVGSGVGDVTENDVFLAKSASSRLWTFEAKAAKPVQRLAETEGVEVRTFNVIYDLLSELTKLIEEGEKKILGKAQILAIFPFDGKRIAGSRVLEGKLTKSDALILMRGEQELGRLRIISLKKQKEEISEASQGEELGILVEPQLDFAVGDVLLSVAK